MPSARKEKEQLERVGYYCRQCKWCGKVEGGLERRQECNQTHAEESRRSHMHRDSDDDTIWSFAPEACDNITATCYVPHGRRYARELLTPSRRTRNHRHGAQHLHTCQGEEVDGVRGGLAGRLRKRKTAHLQVVDRRVLGRIFYIWICRICQIFLRQCLPPSFPFPDCYQHSRSPLPSSPLLPRLSFHPTSYVSRSYARQKCIPSTFEKIQRNFVLTSSSRNK